MDISKLWKSYRVTWTFLTKLCGSVPADPELVKAWVDSRKPAVRPPGGRSIADIQEEVFTTLAEPIDETPLSILVFQRVNGALVMRAATVRAHIKDCARVLSAQWIGKIQGERSFSTRVINGVYPDEATYWIPILRPDGTPILSADGTMDKAVHVRGPRGEMINALKTFEYVMPARMDFTLKILTAKSGAMKTIGKKNEEAKELTSVSQEDLETLFMYGGVHGYAGERGDGEGKYSFTIQPL